MENQTFDSVKACEAQAKLCKENNFPHFAPLSGVCYKCGRNIYRQIENAGYKSGHSIEKASSELITGCPHCHISYCE